MAQRLSVVGEGNIVGNQLFNVGNRTVNYITNAAQPEREKGTRRSLTSNQALFSTFAGKARVIMPYVAFDALLNSKERYPPPRCHAETRIAVQRFVTNWICRKGE